MGEIDEKGDFIALAPSLSWTSNSSAYKKKRITSNRWNGGPS